MRAERRVLPGVGGQQVDGQVTVSGLRGPGERPDPPGARLVGEDRPGPSNRWLVDPAAVPATGATRREDAVEQAVVFEFHAVRGQT